MNLHFFCTVLKVGVSRVSRKWWICDSIFSCVIHAEKHNGNVVGLYVDSHGVAVKGSLCKAGK